MLVNKTNILSLKHGKDAAQYNGNYVWGCFVTNLFPVKAINYSQWNMYIFVLHNLLLSRHMQSYHITYSTFLHMDQITFVLKKVKIWFHNLWVIRMSLLQLRLGQCWIKLKYIIHYNSHRKERNMKSCKTFYDFWR